MKVVDVHVPVVSICFVIFAVCTRSVGHTFNDTRTLLSDLLNGYTADVRPVFDQAAPLHVNMSMDLGAIQDLDEVQEKITIVTGLYMVWMDAGLKWDPALYNGIREITIPSNSVWTPQVILVSSIGPLKPIGSDQGWLTVRYSHDGSAFWSPGDGVVSRCILDVTLFPFDTQSCEFKFIPWGQLARDVMLKHMEDTVLTTFYEENAQWEIVSSHVSSGDTAGGFSHFTVMIDLRRRPKFFFATFMLPVVVINLLSIFVFCIPVQSGERLSFTITVLMSVAVFMNIVVANLPRNSKNMAIVCYLLLANVCICALVVLQTILSLSIYYRSTRVPRCVAVLTRKLISVRDQTKAQFKKRSKHGLHLEEKENDKASNMDGSVECNSIGETSGSVTSSNGIMWNDVSKATDRVLFWLSLAWFTTTALLYMGFVLYHYTDSLKN
ncbi:neuronal acetylcholine receptor subunit alpha-5-like [Mya arenaria]|uniref:neuronal acetylcholine receptor subunit alpha-5-like n=1 Tax=Mya arenaria TaxID=6604 RepID=UPI0022E76943|nr:neuronal acetylcholine receptor subunit alpha-5-like [Mya arenaria]